MSSGLEKLTYDLQTVEYTRDLAEKIPSSFLNARTIGQCIDLIAEINKAIVPETEAGQKNNLLKRTKEIYSERLALLFAQKNKTISDVDAKKVYLERAKAHLARSIAAQEAQIALVKETRSHIPGLIAGLEEERDKKIRDMNDVNLHTEEANRDAIVPQIHAINQRKVDLQQQDGRLKDKLQVLNEQLHALEIHNTNIDIILHNGETQKRVAEEEYQRAIPTSIS